MDLGKFTETQADDHDVFIFDWTDTLDEEGAIDFSKMERLRAHVPKLPKNFARSTILIGEAGGSVAVPLKLKIDWLCLCLDGPAHCVAIEHPIFQSPLKVNPLIEEVPTRDGFDAMTINAPIGPTMKVWRVQSEKYRQVGLVSSLYGFDDSPDAEVIAQGIAGKGPDTVSLARHANFFLWGYSAPPAIMMPAAQRLFVNAICYIHKYDGAVPLVRATSRSREWAIRYSSMARPVSDEARQKQDEAYREFWTKLLEKNPERLPGEYKENVAAFIEDRIKSLHESESRGMELYLPKELREQFGKDAEKYRKYYEENLEYVRPAGGDAAWFVVDEEAKEIGPSNRKIELLDRCVAMLERNDHPDLALRILKRYTNTDCESVEQWQAWLNANRSQLFFSDVGGYKFFVGPESTSTERAN